MAEKYTAKKLAKLLGEDVAVVKELAGVTNQDEELSKEQCLAVVDGCEGNEVAAQIKAVLEAPAVPPPAATKQPNPHGQNLAKEMQG